MVSGAPVRGLSPDQSEPRDDTRGCVRGPGLASIRKLRCNCRPGDAGNRGNRLSDQSLVIWDYYCIASWAHNLCKSSKGLTLPTVQLFLNIFLLFTICPVPMVNILLGLGKSHKTVLFTDILKIQQKASIKLTLQLSILPGVRSV